MKVEHTPLRMVERFARKIPGATRVAAQLRLVLGRGEPRQFLLDMLPKQSVGAEIGVHRGDFSRCILRTVDPRSLHLIDPWQYEPSDKYKDSWYGGQAGGGQAEMDARHDGACRRFARQIRSGQVTIHRGFSTDVLAAFPDEHFDWIYIDGNHLYEFVKRDLELSFVKTKPGGFIAGDDYVTGGWWQGGVKRALDEFVRERPVGDLRIKRRQFVVQKPA